MESQENLIPDGRILGQLLVMQSYLNSLPDETSVFSFTARGLEDIPGVERVQILSGKTEENPPECRVFSISTHQSTFGTIQFYIRDQILFNLYEPYLSNFAFMLAVILEERRQRKIIEEHQEDLTRQISERTTELFVSNQELTRNIRLLNQAQEIAHIGHFLYEAESRSLYWSDEVYRIFGKTPDLFTPGYDNYFRMVHPDDRRFAEEEYRKSLELHDEFDFEVRILLDNGQVKYIQNKGQNEFDESGRHIRTTGMIVDITGKKLTEIELARKSAALEMQNHELIKTNQDLYQSEEKLKRSLSEKTTLIQELFHRTKNNMQLIRSMIRLQARKYQNNREVTQLVEDTERRIQTISLVQQMLYGANDLSRISVSGYIRDLSSLILNGFGKHSQQVCVQFDLEEHHLLIDTVIPLGLIINELLTNSLKYAFPDNREGIISIKFALLPDNYSHLVYSDNGVGFPDGFDYRAESSLGMKLIMNIAEQQMQGKAYFETGNGLIFNLQFSNASYTERV